MPDTNSASYTGHPCASTNSCRTKNIGEACSTYGDCKSGVCLFALPGQANSGYCAGGCSPTRNDCAAGQACVRFKEIDNPQALRYAGTAGEEQTELLDIYVNWCARVGQGSYCFTDDAPNCLGAPCTQVATDGGLTGLGTCGAPDGGLPMAPDGGGACVEGSGGGTPDAGGGGGTPDAGGGGGAADAGAGAGDGG